MNLNMLISALDASELEECERLIRARLNVTYYRDQIHPLTDELRQVYHDSGYVAAIKAYREYYATSLWPAKYAVDEYRKFIGD